MASVRHEYAPVPDPGACVKSRRFPLLSGVVCRWGRLGHGRRYSRWRMYAEADAALRHCPRL